MKTFSFGSITRTAISGFLMLMSTFISGNRELYAQNREKEKKDPVEDAYKESERLAEMLKLSSSQVFYVDSTLQYNLTEMYAQLENMRNSGVLSPTSYQNTQKMWLDRTIEAYRKIFSEDQFYEYMNSIGKGKELKAARKAKEKALKLEEKKRKAEEKNRAR